MPVRFAQRMICARTPNHAQRTAAPIRLRTVGLRACVVFAFLDSSGTTRKNFDRASSRRPRNALLPHERGDMSRKAKTCARGMITIERIAPSPFCARWQLRFCAIFGRFKAGDAGSLVPCG
jgi:hypothetical protein